VKSAVALSRRSVLGLAALVLTGCRNHSTSSQPRVTADAAALASARASEAGLIAAYDAALPSAGRLTARLSAERAVHSRHLAALGGRANVDPAAIGPDRSLRHLLRRSAASLRAAAVGAVDGTQAALLASIGASHEVMARE
jgi:hypothetical protein